MPAVWQPGVDPPKHHRQREKVITAHQLLLPLLPLSHSFWVFIASFAGPSMPGSCIEEIVQILGGKMTPLPIRQTTAWLAAGLGHRSTRFPPSLLPHSVTDQGEKAHRGASEPPSCSWPIPHLPMSSQRKCKQIRDHTWLLANGSLNFFNKKVLKTLVLTQLFCCSIKTTGLQSLSVLSVFAASE